jgi:hypothetical protein
MIERFRTLWLPIRLLLGLTSTVLLVALILSRLYIPYWIAIRDASDPTGRERSADLIAIPDDDSLVWEGEPDDRRLLVVTWASDDESFHQGDEGDSLRPGDFLNTDKYVWVTVVPQLQTVCRKMRPECNGVLNLRLKQLLGLPPHDQSTQFVEFWVSPSDSFRPCPDPAITDSVCNLKPPMNVDRRHHIEWFDKREQLSYGLLGHPWTQLGYTYDWGNPRSEIGLSEFVIEEGANVEVASVTTTDSYLRSSTHRYVFPPSRAEDPKMLLIPADLSSTARSGQVGSCRR